MQSPWEHWRPLLALLGHERRRLQQNRAAVAILALAVAISVLVRFSAQRLQSSREFGVCHIVYWVDDDLVAWLRDRLDRDKPEGITLQPVETFLHPDQTIAYPLGDHSIQIRPIPPVPGEPPGRLIWFWHSGNDPAPLWKAGNWFWNAVHDFLDRDERWHVQTSPLQLTIALPQESLPRLRWRDWTTPQRIGATLAWSILVFVSLHLAMLAIVEDRDAGVTTSIWVSGQGPWRALGAKGVFHVALGVIVAALVRGLVDGASLAHWPVWIALILGGASYFAIACLLAGASPTAPAASSALALYAVCSAVAFGAMTAIPMLMRLLFFHLDRDVVVLLDPSAPASTNVPSLLGLAATSTLCMLLAYRSVRRSLRA